MKYEHFEQHKLLSEELKLEPEEFIPTSCDKTCDQSHTVEIEDLGPDLEEDIEFQNSYTDMTNQILENLINQLLKKRMMVLDFKLIDLSGLKYGQRKTKMQLLK